MYKFKGKQHRHKPVYKKFIRLRNNIQYRRRVFLLKFKKKKWQDLLSFLKRQHKRRKKKFKSYDLNRYILPKYYNPFKKRHKNVLLNKKRVSLFYGGIKDRQFKLYKNLVKKERKSLRKNNKVILNIFEKRLDSILYRSHFTKTMRSAKQLILHKHVKVNNKIVNTDSYLLKSGDIVSISVKMHKLIEKNINSSHLWPIPPKYLQINYKTLEICLLNENIDSNLSLIYPFRINSYHLIRYI